MRNTSADDLVSGIADGATVAAMKDTSGAPLALVRALVRRRVRGLHYICVPTGGLAADILIGAGCIATVEGGGVSLGEHGPAPNFVRAVKSGAVRPLDSTCPALYAALQAGEKGIPFLPMRGLIGSDILTYRDDYKLFDNPLTPGDRLVAVPALKPDLALIHAPLADRHGNLWVGRDHELKILAHAAKRSVATVEALFDGNLTGHPVYAAGTISALYIDAIALAPGGARPCALPGHYAEDGAAMAAYVRAAQTEDGFRDWLAAFLAEAPTMRAAAE